MRKVLAFTFAVAMALSTVAMASDANFLFGSEQVASKTLSAVEMQATEGQLIAVVGAAVGSLVSTGTTVSTINIPLVSAVSVTTVSAGPVSAVVVVVD
ncbi:MAG: hypothetical protein ACT4NX_10280 [Deltaproteobacteria bacterium]